MRVDRKPRQSRAAVTTPLRTRLVTGHLVSVTRECRVFRSALRLDLVFPTFSPNLISLDMSALASAALEQHPSLYFPDGDIILAVKLAPLPQPTSSSTHACGTGDRYRIYRVHKFLLCRHSQVFANMYVDAVPGRGSHDGVPMVEMIGDDPEVFSQMISFLYDPS